MRVAVVNFQRSGHDPFLPQWDHQHGMNLWCAVGFIIVFNDDFSVIHRLTGSRANEVIAILLVMFTHANIGQHMSGIGNCHRIGVNVIADNFADLA